MEITYKITYDGISFSKLKPGDVFKSWIDSDTKRQHILIKANSEEGFAYDLYDNKLISFDQSILVIQLDAKLVITHHSDPDPIGGLNEENNYSK